MKENFISQNYNAHVVGRQKLSRYEWSLMKIMLALHI